MAEFLQRVLSAGLLLALALPAAAPKKFYPDDPILREPPPLPVGRLHPNGTSEAGEILRNTLHELSLKQPASPPKAGDINTIDEVPDSGWFTNRGFNKPEPARPPSAAAPWTVYRAKLDGQTPYLWIEDADGERYAFTFDPKDNLEMATGAGLIGGRLFSALGYNVPPSYIVRFPRERLRLRKNITYLREGRETIMEQRDLEHLLSKAPRYPDGEYRALATSVVPGEILGPFQYFDTRRDDPNDIVPHQHRRVLRALHVFFSWIDYTDARAVHTLDAIQKIDGVRAVRHYLIDFESSLGSGGLLPKEPWNGHTYAIDLHWGLIEMATLGLYSADWGRLPQHALPSTGQFEVDGFEPDKWKPAYPNPAFDNRTAADCFWAARLVAAFSADQLREIVTAAEYTDPRAVQQITQGLIGRRDKIRSYYFSHSLPLGGFDVRDGRLVFRDLGGTGRYSIQWWRFDNRTGIRTLIPGAASFQVPPAREYLAADLSDAPHNLTVYLINGRVVGLDR